MIVKRDGTRVPFNRKKIEDAINKAFLEVDKVLYETDTAYDISKEIEDAQARQIMINEILHLKPRDRDIMILRYGLLDNKELTQKEVAEKLGISQSYISRIEKKVIKRLKVLVNYS